MKQVELASGWIRVRPWLVRALPFVPVVALVALFITSGIRGVNFGYHWDEAGWHLDPARRMVQSGVFLPKSYIYPSFDKWLVLLPSIPHGIYAAIDSAGQPQAIQAAMLAAMDTGGYILQVRSVFIVVSSLGILWVYGAALALRHKNWEALVAAAGLGLSWEFAYHSRWAVTDCLVVQFSALTLFMLCIFRRTGRPRWLYAAAVAAGLSTGTKYTGVFLLAVVVVAGALDLPFRATFKQARRAIEICALAFGVYLITTPATLLDPFLFMTETASIATYYLHGHGGYAATNGWHHGQIVLSYYGLAFFSPYPWLAALLFLAMLAGAVLWVLRDRRFAFILVGFPSLFLLMFCARYRTVVVRNYLFLTPFLALLLARGISDLYRILPFRWLRAGLGAGLAAAFLAQAWWLISAGESIRHVDPDVYVAQAVTYVANHPNTQYRVSKQVRSRARAQKIPLPPNVVEGRRGSEVVFFAQTEGPGSWSWRVNDPFLTKTVFGPREMNFNWYSSWSGHDRVVVMTLEKAKSTGVPLAL